jgi:tetratricopeptide (TPR) repeat protein
MSAESAGVQVRRWQEEVARDPGNAAFLPLADLYRREGRLEVAKRLCQRGLERHPEHVEAHVLLGRILRELGEQERAIDEFDIALHLDPEHRAARRAIGYLCLERRDWSGAVRHLEISSATSPRDDRVASALALARRHLESAAPAAEASPEPAAALADLLHRFVRESRVRFAMLMEPSGRVLLQQGFADDLDLAGFASLGAGVHSASRALAQMLGEPHFAQLVQGEGERQLLIGTVPVGGSELILVAVLGPDATVGLVRVRFHEAAREIAELGWTPKREGARKSAAGFDADLADGLRGARTSSPPQQS